MEHVDTYSVVEPPSLEIQGNSDWDHPSKQCRKQTIYNIYLSFGDDSPNQPIVEIYNDVVVSS